MGVLTFRGSLQTSTSHQQQITTSQYILIIMHQKLSNYMLHKAAYDGIYAETIQTTMRVDRKRKLQSHSSWVSPKMYELLDEKFANCVSNNTDFSITGIIEMRNIILSIISTSTLYLHRKNMPRIAKLSVFCWCWSECDVTSGTLAMAAIVCWQSKADCAE